jgi:DNA-binding Xre family transcriptional regulator
MMTLEQVRASLDDRNLSKVAMAVDMAYDTVRRVANGENKQVSYETIKRLSDYLEGK